MTTTRKHSAPPWHYDRDAKEVWRDEANPVAVALVFSGDDMGDPEEIDADGFLISAAPEMFEALEMILSPSPHYAATKARRDRIAEARAKGLAAIAKARGER